MVAKEHHVFQVYARWNLRVANKPADSCRAECDDSVRAVRQPRRLTGAHRCVSVFNQSVNFHPVLHQALKERMWRRCVVQGDLSRGGVGGKRVVAFCFLHWLVRCATIARPIICFIKTNSVAPRSMAQLTRSTGPRALVASLAAACALAALITLATLSTPSQR